VTERVAFRYSIGLLAVLGGLAGLVGLYLIEVPAGNRDAVVLALGIVLGWGSSVINGEWGSSPAGRRAAEIGANAAEKAADVPPKVQIEQPPGHNVPVEEMKG
jgi:drug/metabolite transporter (DMT)-like permease